MAGGHRRLSLPHALAVVTGALLGVGALYIPERVETLAGPMTPVGFLIATAGALALTVGYATFLSGPLGDRSAGAYLHLSRTWRSRAVGFFTVWPKPAAYAALLALLAQYLARLLALPVAQDTVALVVLGGLLALHLAGPAVVGRLGLLLSGGFTLFVLVLAAAALSVVVPSNFVPLLPTPVLRDQPVLSLGRGALVALFGFVGFEACVGLAGEVESPRETLPRALLGGVTGVGLLVTLIAFVTLGVIPWARMIFATVPFVDAAASGLDVAATALVTPGLVLATLAALVALSWAPTRTLAGLGEVVPPLAHTNRFGAPDVASLVVFGLAGTLVFVDAVFVGLFLVVPGLLVLYVAHGLTTAALPVVNPDLYRACAFRLSPRLLAVCGLSGAGLTALLLWQALTLDPVVVLGYTRVGPTLTGPVADPLVRRPLESAVPALVGWETLGVLVYVAARDYRAEVGVELEPLTRF
ncbi:APC family permease [Salinigranum halophilum]|uniref:APC family permease n=1 Tax=Salinigranum halophilum TaxID=2565931 RepID=UPI00115F2441|nr:APC family permease [Salinigranum halophilum]